MKKIFLNIIIVITTLNCNAQENPPKITIPSQTNYSYEIIVDSLEIPWGMSFIDENDLLVTEKKVGFCTE